MTGRKRDYLFDNIKGFIIFLVVWEHFCGETIRSGSVAGDLLCTAILLFHMSVMMFVSGYFSKRLEDTSMETNIRRILIPYLIMCVLVALMKLVLDGTFVVEVFNPTFAMWYIVVLFFYRMALPYLIKIRGILFWSFLIAMLSGMFPEVASYHTMGRFLTNLPFFLLGYYCSEDFVKKLRSWMRKPEQVIFALAFLILAFGTAGLTIEYSWSSNIYRNNTTYADAGMTNLLGLECRALFYLVGLFAILCFLVCFSEKETFLCKAGRNSLVIYFFHIFVYEFVRRMEELKGPDLFHFFLITVISIVTVAVLSMEIWSRIFNWIVWAVGSIFFTRPFPKKKRYRERIQEEEV